MTDDFCVCADQVLAGVLADPAGDEIEVERCDACKRYAGDLDAAFALTTLVGGTVWFYQHGEGGDVDENGNVEGGDANSRQFSGTYADDDCIASGTDPWIEDADLGLFNALAAPARARVQVSA